MRVVRWFVLGSVALVSLSLVFSTARLRADDKAEKVLPGEKTVTPADPKSDEYYELMKLFVEEGMTVVGVDTHKRSHTFVAADSGGAKLGEITVPAIVPVPFTSGSTAAFVVG